MVARLTLLAVLITQNTVTAPKPFVIRETGMRDVRVCAEYTSPAAPRVPNRACVDAAVVASWILREGRPLDECP